MIISRDKPLLLHRGSLLSVGLALLCSLLFILPAKAEPAPFEDCPSGTLCLYGGGNGSGERRDFAEGRNAESYDAAWDDTTLSAKNNTRLWACVYVDTAYGGLLQTIKPSNPDEYTSDARFAGTISSHKMVPSRAHCFTGYERCPDNRVCTFKEPNGRGTMTVHRPATDAATKNYGDSYGTDVAPRSVWNRTRQHACFYPDPAYTGTWAGPAGGKAYGAYVVLSGDSTTVPAPFAGTFRSHELVNGTSECQ